MSDYSQSIDFSAKDALATGDGNKVAKGADIDTELALISTAIATKYDSNDLASQAQAEAGTSAAVLMTPLQTEQWSAVWAAENGGMIGDIQALADPAADTILGWDDSAGAAINFTIGTGLTTTTTTLSLSFLGLEALTDPNVDALVYWDDSAGALNWLSVDNGLTIDADDTMGLTNVSAGAAQPVVITDGTFTFDLSSITEIVAGSVDQAADGFLLSDAGTLKVVPYDSAGLKVKLAETTGTLALADANTIMEFDATATLTIPVDATHTWEPGSVAILVVDHATQVLTVTAAATVTLNSVYHPGGAAAASDTVVAGGAAALIYLGSDEWFLSGDTTT
jgi:hypothetical protein